jgi:hypothetical protein
MADETLHPSHNGGGTYEHKDADVRLIVGSTLVLIVGMVIVCLIVVGVFRALQDMTATPATATGLRNPNVSEVPPEPRLQPHPAEELKALRQHEDEVLNNYGWVDQKAAVVRIPIDKAMDIMAQRGFPTGGQETAGNATKK